VRVLGFCALGALRARKVLGSDLWVSLPEWLGGRT